MLAKNTYFFSLSIILFSLFSCQKNPSIQQEASAVVSNIQKEPIQKEIAPGIEAFAQYHTLLKGKSIGVVANQSSIFSNGTHLVDSLVQTGIRVTKVYSPEHGFRGKADAGELVKSSKDAKTGLPIVSIYGKNKKPSKEQLAGIDYMLFDLQDVGVRFYTYIYTLHYVMEACAENNIPVIVLDRPNPNAHYVDGPIMEDKHTSFIGMHPTPIVYGMTIGEYGKMINGEKWLKNDITCDLKVIKNQNYDHDMPYELPIKPSPNLPNAQSVNLYPSVCLFEGTAVSVGRGTDMQFQIYGNPSFDPTDFPFSFTPAPNEGAKKPKLNGEKCWGEDLRKYPIMEGISLAWLQKAYKASTNKEKFFTPFINKLAGTTSLQKQIEAGLSEAEIKATWKEGLDAFKKKRALYLLYP